MAHDAQRTKEINWGEDALWLESTKLLQKWDAVVQDVKAPFIPYYYDNIYTPPHSILSGGDYWCSAYHEHELSTVPDGAFIANHENSTLVP